jgi:4'-phosphopantetheinyl transferase EntD
LSEGLIDRVCTPQELRWLREQGEGGAIPWSKLFFSAKESVYKCLFPVFRVFLDFPDVTLRFSAGRFRAATTMPGVDASDLRGRFVLTDTHVLTSAFLRREQRPRTG